MTVSGASPIIDTAATDVGFTFTKELMNTVPNARDVWAMVAQTPGHHDQRASTSAAPRPATRSRSAATASTRARTPTSSTAPTSPTTPTTAPRSSSSTSTRSRRCRSRSTRTAPRCRPPACSLNIVPKSGTNRFTRHRQRLLRQRQHPGGQRRRRAAGARREPGEQPATSTSTPGSTSAGRSCATRSGSGARTASRRSRTSSPARAIADGSSRSTARSSGTRRRRSTGSPSTATTCPASSTWPQKKRFNRGLSALRPVETTAGPAGPSRSPRLFTLRDDWTVGVEPARQRPKVEHHGPGASSSTPSPGVDVDNTPARMTRRPASGPTRRRTIRRSAKNLRAFGATAQLLRATTGSAGRTISSSASTSAVRAFGNQAAAH